MTVRLIGFALLFVCFQVSAGTVNWEGDVSNDWNIAGNWDVGVPGAGDDVVITNTGLPPVFSGTSTIQSLTLSSGTLTIANGSSLSLSAPSSIAGGASLVTTGSGSVSLGSMTLTSQGNINGTLIASATSTLNLNGGVNQTGTVVFAPNGNGATLTSTGGVAVAPTGTLTFSPSTSGTITANLVGAFEVQGTFNIVGTSAVDTRLNINSGANLMISGVLSIQAASSGEGGLLGSGTLTLTSAGQMSVNGANDAVPLDNSTTNNAGVITVVSGTLQTSATLNNSGTLNATAMGAQVNQTGSGVLVSTGDLVGTLITSNGTLALNGDGTQLGPLTLRVNAVGFGLSGHPTNAIPLNSTVTIEPSAGGTITFNVTSSLGVAGTLNLNGNAAVDTRMNINNTFTLTLSGTLNVGAAVGGEGGFLGAGTLSILNGGLLNVAGANDSVPLNCATQNAGTIEVDSGILFLDATVTNSGTMRSLVGARFQQENGRSLTSTGDIAGELFTGNGSVALNGNGTQAGPLRIAPNSVGFTLNGHATNAVPAGSTLTIEPSVGGTITINVSSNFGVAGTLNLNGNATVDTRMDINNTFTLTTSGTLNVGAAAGGEGGFLGAGTLSIVNGGLLNVAGANEAVPLNCATQSAGTIEVASGVLSMDATVTNSGTMRSLATARFQQGNGRSLTSTGNITGELFTGTGSVALNGNGTQAGPLRIAPNAVGFTLNGHATNAVPAGSTLTIEPSVGGTIPFNVGSDFGVAGTLNLNGNAIVDTRMNINNAFVLTLAGTLNVGSSASGEGGFLGTGTLSVLTGGLLNVAGANDFVPLNCTTQNAGTIEVDSGVLFLDAAVTSSGTMRSLATARFQQENGRSLTSTGNIVGELFTGNGSVALNGNGTQAGPLRIAPNAVGFSLSGHATNAIPAGATVTVEPTAGGTITVNLTAPGLGVAGILNLNGTAVVDTVMNVNGGSTLEISGQMIIGSSSNGEGQLAGAGTLSILATGTFTANGSNDAIPIDCPVQNAGILRVSSGTLFQNSSFTNSGLMESIGSARFLQNAGRSLISTGNVRGQLVTGNGSVAFNGNGTQTGPLHLAPNASSFSLSGNTINSIPVGGSLKIEPTTGGTIQFNLTSDFVVNGTMMLNGNSAVDTQMNLNGGTTLTVKGTLNMSAASSGEGQFLGTGTFLLDTTGTVNIQGANDPVPFGNSTVTLNGTFRVTSGLTDIPSITSATAVLSVANGSTLRIGSGSGTATLNGATSRAEGSGTLNGNLTAAGRLRPGLAGAAGTLTVTGTLTLAGTAVLELEVGGNTPGTQFDVLAVGGAASLNGSLSTDFIGGFVPAPNANFTVMTYASRSGSFTLDTDETTLGTYFLSTLNPTNLVLQSKTFPSTQAASLQTQQGLAITNTLNATDADGDALTFTLAAAPAKGGVTITNAATGAFIYTPNPDAVAYDTFTFQASDGQRSRTAVIAITIIPRDSPTVNTLTASRDSIKIGTVIDFSATATDPNALPLTFSWDFNDGSTGSGTPVSHTYTTEGTFVVTLTASNGFNSGTSTVSIVVFAPNPGAEGVKNVSDGGPAVTNPLDGLSVSVASSDGGVIELAIETSGLRAEPTLSTSFEQLSSLFAVRSSRRPVQKFTKPGIFVATTVATDKSTGETLGKVRKTLAVSLRETQPALASSIEPSSKVIEAAALSGKFVFDSEKPDQVAFSGSIELPAGLDLSEPQEVAFSCGNVDDLLRFDARGRLLKTNGSETGRVSKASIKFPRTEKGTTLTAAGQTAKFSATLKLPGLSTEGFDTEGISNRLREDETGKKGGADRSIQIALVLGGVAYETRAPVKFLLASKGAGGKIKGRAAR